MHILSSFRFVSDLESSLFAGQSAGAASAQHMKAIRGEGGGVGIPPSGKSSPALKDAFGVRGRVHWGEEGVIHGGHINPVRRRL